MKNEKGSFKSFLTARNTKKGALSVTITVLVIAAIVLVNVIVSSLSTRYSLYADLTSNSAYRLQDATAEYAASVSKDVKIIVLANETVFENYGDYYVQANKLVRQFAECSPKISLQYVDLTTNPKFPSNYPDVDWTKSHLILLVCGERYRVIDAEDLFDYEMDQTSYSYVISDQHIEQVLASSVLNLTADSLTTVSLLIGQAEEEADAFTKLLTDNAFAVEEVDLVTGSISEDSEFLIIYAPSVDIDEDMAATIQAWLINGGDYGHHLLYFPTDKKDVGEFPNLNALIENWGMSVDFGYIYESDATYIASSLNTALCSRYDYADDTLTEDLPNADIPVYLYYTLPVNITDSVVAAPLLTSSEKAFFGPMQQDNTEEFEPDQHVYIGAAMGTKNAGTDDGQSSHVLVFGSYDWLSEGFLKYNSYNNAAYFVNIFNTLADRAQTGVIIEGKKLDDTTLGADSAASVSFVAALVRWVIPIGVLIAGLAVFLLRRFR